MFPDINKPSGIGEIKSVANPAKDTVCAIIVTFNPGSTFPEHLKRIQTQVSEVMIVDNASSEDPKDILKGVLGPSVTLIQNPDNYGIAVALNQGIQRAESLGYPWVVLFDQDSDIDENLIEELCATYQSIPDNQDIAIIGPEFRDILKSSRKPSARKDAEADWTEVKRLITSGSLMPVSLFKNIGQFREDLFIYYVDNEYCFRAQQLGYRLIKTVKPLMTHTYGTPTKHRYFFTEKWVKNYSPSTCYYIMRNYTIFLRDCDQLPLFKWFPRSFFRMLKNARPILFFESSKFAKISSLIQGWVDGIRKKTGKKTP
jgi:rhamnosyltransferase